MMEYDKLNVKDFIILLMLVIGFMVLLSGCATSSKACLDGYLYDKNEHGYEIKVKDGKYENC